LHRPSGRATASARAAPVGRRRQGRQPRLLPRCLRQANFYCSVGTPAALGAPHFFPQSLPPASAVEARRATARLRRAARTMMRLRFMTLPPESAAEVANATTRRPPPPSPKRGIAPSPIQRLRRTTDAALKKGGRVEPAAIRIPSAQRPVQQSNIPDSYWDASGAPPLVACSWCGRLRLDGIWLRRKEARRRLGLAAGDPLPPMTHGICPDCWERVNVS
jgi:hypothetical protein